MISKVEAARTTAPPARFLERVGLPLAVIVRAGEVGSCLRLREVSGPCLRLAPWQRVGVGRRGSVDEWVAARARSGC